MRDFDFSFKKKKSLSDEVADDVRSARSKFGMKKEKEEYESDRDEEMSDPGQMLADALGLKVDDEKLEAVNKALKLAVEHYCDPESF